jgi:poly-beta-1,6-N-acetyl-D-glucosamine synthase
MLTFYLLFGIVYGLLLLLLGKTWKEKPHIFPEKKEFEQVTILIPYRNEKHNIASIFHQVPSLTYRPLQVIFINDQSNDGGQEQLEKLIQG